MKLEVKKKELTADILAQKVAEYFVREIICWSDIPGHGKPLVLTCSDY